MPHTLGSQPGAPKLRAEIVPNRARDRTPTIDLVVGNAGKAAARGSMLLPASRRPLPAAPLLPGGWARSARLERDRRALEFERQAM